MPPQVHDALSDLLSYFWKDEEEFYKRNGGGSIFEAMLILEKWRLADWKANAIAKAAEAAAAVKEAEVAIAEAAAHAAEVEIEAKVCAFESEEVSDVG